MLASSVPLPEKAGMAQGDTRDQSSRAIEAVFRIERARLIASLARMTRDVDRAEELAHEALPIALDIWPKVGVLANPGAWLTATVKRRAVDGFRRADLAAGRRADGRGDRARLSVE